MTAPALYASVQGQGSASADNLNTYQQSCDTISQLRGFIGLPGIQVMTRGASAINDGGGATYYWSATSVAPDNGSTIIAPNGAAMGRWLRLQISNTSIGVYGFETTTAALTFFAAASTPADGTIFLSDGRTSEGDGGGGQFYYVASDTTSADNGGTLRVDGAGHRWYYWNREQAINLSLFCGLGDGTTDNATGIQAAINALPSTGGAIYVPSGTFVYGSNIRILTNNVTITGNGWSSILQPKNSAGFYIGLAQSVGGFVAYFPTIEKVAWAAQANHNGDILIADQTQNLTIRDVDVSVLSNNGSTQTNGLRLNWTQYTVVENLHSFVNGYNIYIYLTTSPLQNEDHFSFRSCWLYSAKTPKSGTTPGNIVVQRTAGRTTNIGQFGVYDTHFGKFLDGGASGTTTGILVINEESGSDLRVFECANVETCFFENHDYGFSSGTAATNDTSRIFFRCCYFLAIGTWSIYGSNVFKTTGACLGCYFLNSAGGTYQIHMSWDGANIFSNVTTPINDNITDYRLANKWGQGSVTSSSSTVQLRNSGTATVAGSATTAVITHGLNEFGTGLTPNEFSINPTWNTTYWLTSIGSTTFTVNFGTAPGSSSSLYWLAEISEF